MVMDIQNAITILEQAGYEVIPPESGDTDPLFLRWWDTYNKKRNKYGCLRKWNRMSVKERDKCLAATPAYVASCTEGKKFQKDPLTYLNQKAWEDEIIYEQDERRNFFYDKAARIINSD